MLGAGRIDTSLQGSIYEEDVDYREFGDTFTISACRQVDDR